MKTITETKAVRIAREWDSFNRRYVFNLRGAGYPLDGMTLSISDAADARFQLTRLNIRRKEAGLSIFVAH